MSTRLPLSLVGLFALAASAFGQLTIPSDGSDGTFIPYTTTYVDLSQAVTGTWNTPAPIPGKGVYDPVQWAVVYKYSSVNIGGYNIYFTPHPSGAPVVWLVDGDVTINGNLNLQGGDSNAITQSLPGPGGFRGGAAAYLIAGSAGFGPGGGNYTTDFTQAGGSHGTIGNNDSGPVYGNPKCIPLIGGSGGSGRSAYSHGGAAGGGAILIAAKGTITINGTINTYGGATQTGMGGGSGGTIRLVGSVVNVPGSLQAQGQSGGGSGRIRIESTSGNVTGNLLPVPSVVTAAQTPQIWPDNTAPKLEIIQVGTQAAPADPHANLLQPDVPLTSGGSKTVTVRAYNVPTDGSWAVQVRQTPRNGKESYATCTFSSGNQAISLWQCTLNFDSGAAALIARAYKL